MRRRSFLTIFLLLAVLAACSPAEPQPIFDLKTVPPATSIPLPTDARVVVTLSHRIISFDVSPDAAFIALATSGGVKVYNMRTYKELRGLNQGELVSAVAWSPDGARLAVGSTKDYGTPFFTGGDSDNAHKARLTVWDTSSWKLVFEPAFGNEMVNQGFADLAWSPDGHSLAFSTDLGGVQVLDIQTGQTVSRQTEFSSTVQGISWSPDGTRLVATGDMAYGIRRWKLATNEAVRLFDPRASRSFVVAWSPDGKRIASGHADGGLCFWTAATNECDGFVHAHRSATFSLAWSPDGTRLATGGGVIRIWNSRTGKLIKAFGEESGYMYARLEWPENLASLVSLESSFGDLGKTVLRIWDLKSGLITAEIRGTQS